LTESNELSQWLLPNDFEPRVGHRFTFREETYSRKNSCIVECEVIAVEPLRCLAYTWSTHSSMPEMLISFTLESVAGGTCLHLEQKVFVRTEQSVTLVQKALPSLHTLLAGGLPHMSRFFHIEVDEPALTDALYAFVTDPKPSRNERPVIQELHSFVPEMVSVLEHMVLDGVKERQDVVDYVNFVFGRVSL
jgi:uncharacterized protein YndB with AHSA1/START domain